MVAWPDVVDAVTSTSAPVELPLRKSRSPFHSGATAVVVTGHAGAGKSKLWSTLTMRDYGTPATSVATDDGYVLMPNKRRAAVTTIPSQYSRSRQVAVAEMFESDRTIVNGVIFVTSYGYDHVWPQGRDVVASTLKPFELESLRRRNLEQEIDAFRETCRYILTKHSIAKEGAPRWLLVAANKADLYWSQEEEAKQYYSLDPNSAFVAVKDDLLDKLGSMSIQYQAVPVATEPLDFDFRSAWGRISAATSLTSDQCNRSIELFVETLGDLQ